MDLDNKEQLESGLSLVDIFNIIKASWIMITVSTLLVGLVTVFYVFNFVEDEYRSTSEILLQLPLIGGQIDSNTLLNSQRLLDTASQFARSPHIVDQLQDAEYRNLFTNPEHVELLDALSTRAIINAIKVSSSNTSFILRLSYSSSDGDFAQVMTSVLTAILIENEIDMFRGAFIELSPASAPFDNSPSRILYVIIGLMVGGIVGIGFAFIKHSLNNSYMTKEQLELGTGIQVIGVIPIIEMKESKKK